MKKPYLRMTHIVAGYPTLLESQRLAETMLDCGVDFLEIQIPFSDPIGDGPTITQACRSAIASGTRVKDAFALMTTLRSRTKIPLLFMTYYNILLCRGVETFCREAKACGCYGLIVPDLPFDHEPNDHLRAIAHQHGLKVIQLVSPITPEDRLRAIGKIAEGFVYCVAGFGTTGTKQQSIETIEPYLRRVRQHVSVPLALGFGIDSQDAMNAAGQSADIVVVGSKILSLYKEGGIPLVQQFLSP